MVDEHAGKLRYGRIWLAFARANVQRILEYRLSFFIGIVSVLTRHVVGVLTLWVIFSQVRSIGGWSAYQVVYLYAYVALIGAIHDAALPGGDRMDDSRIAMVGHSRGGVAAILASGALVAAEIGSVRSRKTGDPWLVFSP